MSKKKKRSRCPLLQLKSNAQTLAHMSASRPSRPPPSVHSAVLLFLLLVSVQELQRGPGDGPSDGAALRLRPDLHYGEDHLRFLPSAAGGTAVPPEPEGGGGHAQVQAPGQVSGERAAMLGDGPLIGSLSVSLCYHVKSESLARTWVDTKLSVAVSAPKPLGEAPRYHQAESKGRLSSHAL